MLFIFSCNMRISLVRGMTVVFLCYFPNIGFLSHNDHMIVD